MDREGDEPRMGLRMLPVGFRLKHGRIAGLRIWLLLDFSPRYLPGEKPLRILSISLGLGALIFLAHRDL